MDLYLIFTTVFVTFLQIKWAYQSELYRCPITSLEHIGTFGSKCYEFVLHKTDERDDAKTYCRRKGGSLVTIDSHDVQTYVYNTLRSLHFHGEGVWIGLTDAGHENTYTWDSGTPLRYQNWAPGQPGILHSLEDCVLMLMEDGGKWHDYRCSDILFVTEHDSWVCEYHMRPPTTHSVITHYLVTTKPMMTTSHTTTRPTIKTAPPTTTTTSTTKSTRRRSPTTTLILTDAYVASTTAPPETKTPKHTPYQRTVTTSTHAYKPTGNIIPTSTEVVVVDLIGK